MTRSKIYLAGAASALALALGGVGIAALTSQAMAAGDVTASAKRVDNFRLASADLQSYELYRMADAPAVVILTQSNGCAASQAAAAVMQGLKSQYKAKGVEFLMLNSNLKDSRDAQFAEWKKMGGDIPILMDADQLAGEGLGVTKAGEAIVINPKTWQVVYRGALDAKSGAQVLDSVISGSPVQVAAKSANGCAIDFPAHAKPAELAKISYTKQIAPIIEDKCVACHQAGGIGPMELTSYEKVKGFAPMIREVIRTQRMPPYQADPSVGHFSGDKRLSPDQIKTLVHWIEAGAPRGEGTDTLAQVRHQAPEWPLGKPDVILDIPSYTIPASGIVDYQRPWVANPLTEGRWLRASTIKVGQRQGVHHILTGYMTEVPTGKAANESRWGVSVGGYAVGAESQVNPTNVGVFIPPGGAIGFQNHYTPFGKEAVDKSQIGLYFYDKDKTPDMVMHGSVIADPSISIPAGEERHTETAYIVFPKDALLYSAFPHAHYRGQASQLEMITPDGKRSLILSLPKYDFNWQRDYTFQEPIKIPAGTKLVATYTYDNSKRNPANPDAKRVVPWGDQSFDEMLYTALRYRWIDETSKKPVDYDIALNASRTLGMLDDNIDGKIEQSELKGPIGNQLKAAFAQLDTDHDGTLSAAELAAAGGMQGRGRRAAN
jgi:mono/diheme cytochrome c family protein